MTSTRKRVHPLLYTPEEYEENKELLYSDHLPFMVNLNVGSEPLKIISWNILQKNASASGFHKSKGWETDNDYTLRIKRILKTLESFIKNHDPASIVLQEVDHQLFDEAFREFKKTYPDWTHDIDFSELSKSNTIILYNTKKLSAVNNNNEKNHTYEDSQGVGFYESQLFELANPPKEKIRINTTYGKFSETPEKHEEFYRNKLKTEKKGITSIILGDTNTRVAPKNKEKKPIMTTAIPLIHTQGQLKTDFPDAAFTIDDNGEINQLEISILNPYNGLIYKHESAELDNADHNEYHMLACISDEMKYAHEDLFKLQENLNHNFPEDNIIIRPTSNDLNERSVGVSCKQSGAFSKRINNLQESIRLKNFNDIEIRTAPADSASTMRDFLQTTLNKIIEEKKELITPILNKFNPNEQKKINREINNHKLGFILTFNGQEPKQQAQQVKQIDIAINFDKYLKTYKVFERNSINLNNLKVFLNDLKDRYHFKPSTINNLFPKNINLPDNLQSFYYKEDATKKEDEELGKHLDKIKILVKDLNFKKTDSYIRDIIKIVNSNIPNIKKMNMIQHAIYTSFINRNLRSRLGRTHETEYFDQYCLNPKEIPASLEKFIQNKHPELLGKINKETSSPPQEKSSTLDDLEIQLAYINKFTDMISNKDKENNINFAIITYGNIRESVDQKINYPIHALEKIPDKKEMKFNEIYIQTPFDEKSFFCYTKTKGPITINFTEKFSKNYFEELLRINNSLSSDDIKNKLNILTELNLPESEKKIKILPLSGNKNKDNDEIFLFNEEGEPTANDINISVVNQERYSQKTLENNYNITDSKFSSKERLIIAAVDMETERQLTLEGKLKEKINSNKKEALNDIFSSKTFSTGLNNHSLKLDPEFNQHLIKVKSNIEKKINSIKTNSITNITAAIDAWKKNNRSFLIPTGIKAIKKILRSTINDDQKRGRIFEVLKKCKSSASPTRHPMTQETYALIEKLLISAPLDAEKDFSTSIKNGSLKMQRLRCELDKLPTQFCDQLDEIKALVANKNSSITDMLEHINQILNKPWLLSSEASSLDVFENANKEKVAQSIREGVQNFIENVKTKTNYQDSLIDLIQDCDKKVYKFGKDTSLKNILEYSKKSEIIIQEQFQPKYRN